MITVEVIRNGVTVANTQQVVRVSPIQSTIVGGADVGTYIAGTNLSALRAVRGDGTGSVVYSDASVFANCKGTIGITTQATTIGNTLVVRHSGMMMDASWTWVPGPIYLGANGVLQQVSGVHCLQVAVALDATHINIDIQQPIEVI